MESLLTKHSIRLKKVLLQKDTVISLERLQRKKKMW